MTPAAPIATWRKVCEENFSRLIEDLEQQVESEVETRVSAVIDAAVQGAVSNATAESRRALAEELNQAVRRVRQATSADELYATLLDVTIPFCEHAAVFSVDRDLARAERMRRPLAVEPGEGAAPPSLPPLEFRLSEAAAFSTAIETRDPVIAMSAPAEVSSALLNLFGHQPDERVYLFPFVAAGAVAGIFYAARNVQPPLLELLSEVAGLQLHALTVVPAKPSAAETPALTQIMESERKQPARGVTTAALWNQPEADYSAPSETGSGMATSSETHKEWRDLSRDAQHLHLAAQRFARVKVAEMRLEIPEAVRSGKEAHNIYRSLQPRIDAARESFREKHMSASPTMVDYLHLEMVRSLANDDADLLGPEYPGPLV